jgi:protein involved in polysaccharide export with SLBB domain
MKYKIILSFCIAIVSIAVSAQEINPSNLGNLNVDELSDTQIENLIQRAEESGMTQQQLEAAAMSRGMAPSEIQKLRERIEEIEGTQEIGSQAPTRLRTNKAEFKEEALDEITLNFLDSLEIEEDKEKEKYFGYSIFSNKQLTFEPALNLATPKGYILGPGDEVIIDVWGASQQNYQLEISPEGSIFIDNLGPVYLAGNSIEKANGILKKRLTNIYSGLSGNEPNTFMQVSLGKLRSIKVNILGEVESPGTYTLQSFATVLNALYYADGPSLSGSLREIEVVRTGKTPITVDLYSFLMNGTSENNITLQDNDIVVVKPYINRVEIKGEAKRALIYEGLEGETLDQILRYSGGFTENAFTELVKIERKEDGQLTFYDVPIADFATFSIENGDKIIINPIVKRFKNRVKIDGAIIRPGYFELGEKMTLAELIDKAGGLSPDAFRSYASVYRLNANDQMEIIPVDLNYLASKNIVLQEEDFVKIPSIFDIEEEFTVRIEGEVKSPGEYSYFKQLSIQELIVLAGGLKESASFARVEVARRIKDNEAIAPKNEVSQVLTFGIDKNLKLNIDSTLTLKPYDVVFIRKSPGYEEQQFVTIKGEVAFPGKYAITNKSETISDLLSRAGGLTSTAYIPGARLSRIVEQDKEREKALEVIQTVSEDSLNIDLLKEQNRAIGIDLHKILDNPHSKFDLFVEGGDKISIPKQLQTVAVNGAILYPSTPAFKNGQSARRYIAQAGGFAQNAKKSKVYILYPNGSVNKTSSFLGINKYPKILPGTEIIVPEKPKKEELTTQEMLAIGTAASSFALVLINIINRF